MPAVIILPTGKKGAAMPPPTMPGKKPKPMGSFMSPPKFGGDEMDTKPDGDEGGLSPEEVHYSADDLCSECAHGSQGETCSKYQFAISPNGHCAAGFEPQGGSAQDDQGSGEGSSPWDQGE